MSYKEIEKKNAAVAWKPRYALGDWVYCGFAKGPVIVCGYVHNGYMVHLLGRPELLVSLRHETHRWTKAIAAKWAKRK